MTGRPPIVLDPASMNAIWANWKAGLSINAISRSLDVGYAKASELVGERGGITPLPRRRSPRQLSMREREEISRGVAVGDTDREIGARIGRAHTTVWREVKRHGGRQAYRAAQADQRTWDSARRPQACRLSSRPDLCETIAAKLTVDWSPKQISEWLEIEFPDDQEMRVSHETIYKSLFIQSRGALKKELTAHLRRGRARRKPQAATRVDRGHGSIVGAISISERPPEAKDRAVVGHWEGDLILGKGNHSQIVTLVERHSRFVMLIKIDSKETEVVTAALARKIHELPEQLKRSLTWDRGSEMADHKKFSIATKLDVYFCDPASPWQRGSNENTNGLLRQYFPKGTDLSVHDQEHLDFIADRLNTRPRETLGYRTPAATLEEALR